MDVDRFVGCMPARIVEGRCVDFDCEIGVVVGSVELLGFVLRLDRWEARRLGGCLFGLGFAWSVEGGEGVSLAGVWS